MKTNKKKGSATKKLLPAFAMLTVSAMSLSSATYAWFTMNKEVTVTGMSLKTKVGSNLLVCQTNVEADYTDDLVQNRSALLEPVSTINATDSKFFYTVNAAADGHWLQGANSMKTYSEAASGDPVTNTNATATAIGKTNYDATFNSTYGITPGATTQFDTAYGYVDYVFFLKATSDAADSAIRLTECNLIYDNAAVGSGDYAWRVAIFAKEIDDKGNGTTNQAITSADTDLVSILDIKANAKNWNEGTEAINTVAPQAISAEAGTKAAVTKANTAVSFGDIDAGDTAYYKVVARVWLEGEDQSCKSSTYADLSDKIWELGLQFELNQGTAVDTISSVLNNDTGTIMAGGGGATSTPLDNTTTTSVNLGANTLTYSYNGTAWSLTSGSWADATGTWKVTGDTTADVSTAEKLLAYVGTKITDKEKAAAGITITDET